MSDTKKILGAVSTFVAYNADGTLNEGATASALLAQIRAEIEENRAYDAVIGQALHTLFDRLPADGKLPTPMVVQAVASELASGDIARVVTLAPMVADYIERSPHFQAKRGRSGGLQRVSKP